MQLRGLTHDRARFREIFCQVLSERGDQLPDYRSCDEAITTVGVEPPGTGRRVSTGRNSSNFLVLYVPGFGWECVEQWLDLDGAAIDHVAQLGYEGRQLRVGGLSSTSQNAGQIRDQIAALEAPDDDRPIVLVGYSKGTPDILTALVEFPELRQRVDIVVSLSGSVLGSPLADAAKQSQANLLAHFTGSRCDVGDSGALESLRPAVRRDWMEKNPPPDGIKYFSMVTFPESGRVSGSLKNAYRTLSSYDQRNDSQVLIYDQVIPDSTLLGYANANHWSMAIPVAKGHPIIGSTLVDNIDYPREAFLEALLRYLEDYVSGQHSPGG